MFVDRNRIDANDRADAESIAQLLSHSFAEGDHTSTLLDYALGDGRQEFVIVDIFRFGWIRKTVSSGHRVDRELNSLGLSDA
jgi:hypothetical protein